MALKQIVVVAAAAAGLGALAFRGRKKRRRARAAAPQPGVQELEFTSGGETELALAPGDKFSIKWDPALPWTYTAEATETTVVDAQGDNFFTFRLAQALPPGTVDQVFVLASDAEGEGVGSAHKVTIFGPTEAGS